jgi:hypothetical protein
LKKWRNGFATPVVKLKNAYETIRFASLCCLVLTALFLNGCIKDTVKRSYTYTMFQPVFKTTAEVRANIKSNPSESIQQPGKLFIQGHYIFLNEVDKGIHVIDNSNPAQPRNVAFIDIPGNVDLAVKGNTLYADLYTDLIHWTSPTRWM